MAIGKGEGLLANAHLRSLGPQANCQDEVSLNHKTSKDLSRGFTIIELMVVIAIILILASFALPSYHIAVVHSREAVLRDDLFTMRKMIDEYTIDKQHPPTSLDDLVDSGYLRGGVPVDPMTQSNQTWKSDIEEVPISADQSTSGVVDVHSGSDDEALDGTQYSSW